MNIPGFHDLIARGLVDDDPSKCSKAAANCLLPITSGIEAIGQMMGSYDDNSGLPDGTIQDLGHLLAFLAKAALDLQHMKADADFNLRVAAVGREIEHA